MVPKNKSRGFVLPAVGPGNHFPGVYQAANGCVFIFFDNGDCLNTPSMSTPPLAVLLETSSGEAGRYKLRAQSLIIESLSWDNNGRRYVVYEAETDHDVVRFLRWRWRDESEWRSFDAAPDELRKVPNMSLKRTPFW